MNTSKTRTLGRVQLNIIRILTNNQSMDIDTIALLANANKQRVKILMDEFERSGYVARLDYGQYCATR